MNENLNSFKNFFKFINYFCCYIAAPLSETGTIQVIAGNAEKSKIYDSSDLIKWLKSRYGSCKFYQDFEGEVISLVEQSILTSATDFLLWPSSSWSSRIADLRQQRAMERKDLPRSGLQKRSLLELLKNSMTE